MCPTGDHDADKMDGWLPRPGKAMAYMSGGEAAGYNFLTWELGASWAPGAGIVPDESSTLYQSMFIKNILNMGRGEVRTCDG